MIIGNGLLAKAFEAYENTNGYLIFASGVSNSLETRKSEFKREFDLLTECMKKNPYKSIVYFSTCSIYDQSVASRPYIKHKLAIEHFIESNATSFFIFRLPNVVGYGGNDHTISELSFNQIKKKRETDIWVNATRNILDIEDVAQIIFTILNESESNKTINIANPKSFNVTDIVCQIEDFLGERALITKLHKGEAVHIDTSEFEDYISSVISPQKGSIDYISQLLNKYYAK